MTATELARLVREMRRYQVRYFKLRDGGDLRASKDYERRVDAAVSALLDPQQPGLPLDQSEKPSDRG